MLNELTLQPIAHFKSPLTSKFGIPRQSGLVKELEGEIIFEKDFKTLDAIRGIGDFDYLWLIWEFSANRKEQDSGATGNKPSGHCSLTVRPPRLGGNTRLGVFATRSPFRPNPIGLSCVKISRISEDGRIYVKGADLMDGTPIYDIKPYIPYTDAHPEASGGFTDATSWRQLDVEIADEFASLFNADELKSLQGILAEDPRPQYHDDPERIYGMPFAGRDVKFKVSNGKLTVTGITRQ